MSRSFERNLRYSTGFFVLLLIFSAISSCSLRSPYVSSGIDGSGRAEEAVEVEGGGPVINEGFAGMRLEEAANDYRLGRYALAREKLLGLRGFFPDTGLSARSSFLLGMIGLEDGSSEAASFFDEASSITEIEDYALLFKGRSYYRAGLYGQALDSLETLVSMYPDSVLMEEALFLRASALMDSGDTEKAIKGLTGFIERYPKGSRVTEALLKLAAARISLNEPSLALAPIRTILSEYPASEAAIRAEEFLNGIRASGVEAPGLTAAERFTRASRLFDATRYRAASKEFLGMAKAADREYYDRAMIKAARAEMRLKDYEQALKALGDYLSGPLKPALEAEALALQGLTALRLDREDALLKAEKKLAGRYPDSAERASVLFYLGHYYASKNRNDRAAEFFSKVIDAFRDAPSAQDALWALSWMNYRSGSFADACSGFAKGALKNDARLLYWAGRCAEKTGGFNEAAAYYRKVCSVEDGGYYCGLTDLRLAVLGEAGALESVSFESMTDGVAQGLELAERPDIFGYENGDEEALQMDTGEEGGIPARVPLYADRHYAAARELLSLGLSPMSAREAELLAKRYSKDVEALKELARLFYDAGDFHRAFRIYRLYLSRANTYDDGIMAFSYPPKVVDLVRDKAKAGSADPCLVAAVMREESHFNPSVVSTAGAIGLMQIMPDTARAVSLELHKEKFEVKELFDPSTSIEFGSWYLGSLLRRFDNNVILAIAGYNAGPDAAERWVETLPSEPDEFIESIPYAETRNYTKRVLRSYYEFLKASGQSPSRHILRSAIPHPKSHRRGSI